MPSLKRDLIDCEEERELLEEKLLRANKRLNEESLVAEGLSLIVRTHIPWLAYGCLCPECVRTIVFSIKSKGNRRGKSSNKRA